MLGRYVCMKTLTALLSLLLLFGCQKDRIKLTDHSELIGDYDWYHSAAIYSDDYASYLSSPDDYGIRFKKNGKVEYYTNGDLSEKGYVLSVSDSLLVIQKAESTQQITINGSELVVKNYPFSGINNFKKHE